VVIARTRGSMPQADGFGTATAASAEQQHDNQAVQTCEEGSASSDNRDNDVGRDLLSGFLGIIEYADTLGTLVESACSGQGTSLYDQGIVELPLSTSRPANGEANVCSVLDEALVRIATAPMSPSLFPPTTSHAKATGDPMWLPPEPMSPSIHSLSPLVSPRRNFNPLHVWQGPEGSDTTVSLGQPSDASEASDSGIVSVADSLSGSSAVMGDATAFGNSVFDMAELVALSRRSERPRLSSNEAMGLPRVRFQAPEPRSCSICMDTFRHGAVVTGLPCEHMFHVECLVEWVQRSAQCPNCRTPIRPNSK